MLIIAYFGVLLALSKPLGIFLHQLFSGARDFLLPELRPMERGLSRLSGESLLDGLRDRLDNVDIHLVEAARARG